MKAFGIMLFFCVLLLQPAIAGENKSEWRLIHKEGNIEFYSRAMMTDSGKNAQALLKIKNKSAKEVRVQFDTVMLCADDSNNKQHENVLLSNMGMAMFTYKLCDTNSAIEIKQVMVSK